MVDVKHEAFLDLEFSLTERLSAAWRREAVKIGREIDALVKKGRFQEASILIDKIDLTPMVRRNEKYIRTMGMTSLLLGASRISKDLKDSKVYQSPPVEVLDSSYRQFELMLGINATDQITLMMQRKLSEMEAKMTQGAVTKAEVAGIKIVTPASGPKAGPPDKYPGFEYESLFSTDLPKVTDPFLSATSSLHVSRLNSFGFLQEALERNITTYMVNEVLDNRTCSVCQEMHGKTFSVESAVNQAMQIMGTDNPDELRSIAPWPSQSKDSVASIKGASTDELAARGLMMPPYHPRCRGFIDVSTSTDRVPVTSEAYIRATEAAKDYVLKGHWKDPDSRVEYLAVVDPKKESIVLRLVGQKNRAPIPPDYDDLLKDTDLYHSHPDLGSLSGSDLMVLRSRALRSMSAVAPDGSTFTAALGYEGANISEVELGNMYAIVKDRVVALLKPMVSSGVMKDYEARFLTTHLTQSVLGRDKVVTYTFQLSAEAEAIVEKFDLKGIMSKISNVTGSEIDW